MTEAFHQSGSENVLLVVLTNDNGLGPTDEDTYHTLIDKLRQDTRDVVMLQDFLSTPALRDVMTSKDHQAWYLPIGLAGPSGSPQLHEAYARVADIVKQTVAGSSATAHLTGPAATGADITDFGERDLHLIEIATAIMVLTILLIIYRNPVTMLLPLITIGIRGDYTGHCGWVVSTRFWHFESDHYVDERDDGRRGNRLRRLSRQPLSRLPDIGSGISRCASGHT